MNVLCLVLVNNKPSMAEINVCRETANYSDCIHRAITCTLVVMLIKASKTLVQQFYMNMQTIRCRKGQGGH